MTRLERGMSVNAESDVNGKQRGSPTKHKQMWSLRCCCGLAGQTEAIPLNYRKTRWQELPT